MSIVEENKIDYISIRKELGEVVLTISDHLDWEDEMFHLESLQTKINVYIDFIESGQIKIDYPDSVLIDKKRIEIVCKYDYPEIGMKFLNKVEPVLSSIGVGLSIRKLDKL